MDVTICSILHKQYERGGITLDKQFIELCQTYHAKVLKYLYYAVGSEQDALDLVQEVFVVVYKNMDKLICHENVGGYIFQTAKYQAANFKRKAITKRSREFYDAVESLSGTKDLHEELMQAYEDAIDVELVADQILSRLSEEKQSLYKFYYVEKMSYAQIADRLSMKEAAVRMKYMRLRREIANQAKMYAHDNFQMDASKDSVDTV